jgi:hypothetical protein
MSVGRVTFYPNYAFYAGFDRSTEPSITGQGYLCSGGESTGPAYDLFDCKRTSIITMDTYDEADNPIIDIDLTTDLATCDFALLDNHNCLTAGANICIKYGASTTYTYLSKGYSGLLGSQTTDETISSNYVVTPHNGVCLLLCDMDHVISAENNYEMGFDANAGDTLFNADVTAGEVAFGVRFSPTYSPDIDDAFGQNYPIIINESDAGQRVAFKKQGLRRTWRLGWEYLTPADKTGFETLWAVTGGGLYPFWVDLGETSPPTLYYVRFMQTSFEFIKKTQAAYKFTMLLEEEL